MKLFRFKNMSHDTELGRRQLDVLTPVPVKKVLEIDGQEYQNPAYDSVLDLVDKIKDPKCKNIAVTGEYGTGKTSVINTAIDILKNKKEYKKKFVSISLAALYRTVSFRELETDYLEQLKELEQQIEYSILQQILYCHDPERTPRSSFNRLYKISLGNILIHYLLPVSLLISSLVVLFEPSWLRVDSFVSALEHLRESKLIVDCIALIVLLFSVVCIAYDLFNKYNFPFKKVSFSKAEVEISPKSTFNHYLDEITYFFSNSPESIVVFEDLDRFQEEICITIFNKLRELNFLLNSCTTIKKARRDKITFVYA